MNIYIASKTKHAEKWRRLRDDQQYRIVSSWIDEAGAGETKDKSDLAQRCIREAYEADILLLYAEEGEYLKGAFIELGAAMAFNTPVCIVGPALPDSSAFLSHPHIYRFDNVDDALTFITGL